MTLRLKLMGIASIKTPPARFVLGARHAKHRRAGALWRRPAQRPPPRRGSQSSSGSPKEETEGQSWRVLLLPDWRFPMIRLATLTALAALTAM